MIRIDQKALVQETFAMIAPIADDAAGLFYKRLFELDPSLRQMFPENLTEQRKKLMQMLAAAVKGLDHPEQLIPVLRDLGRRHAGYGVADAHYDTVGEALVWTLGQGLGRAFTPQVKDAWVEVYTLIATTMRDAAKTPVAAARPQIIGGGRGMPTPGTVSRSEVSEATQPSGANQGTLA